jgi:hypothetical protein
LVYYDVIQDKAVISIDFQSLNYDNHEFKLLDFTIDKEFEIIFYIWGFYNYRYIHFFDALDIIKN